MDDIKMLLILLMLILEACSRRSEQKECKNYPSPYEVEFPDNSVQKSNISLCGQELIAAPLDGSKEILVSESLIVRLEDTKTGELYFTAFDGQ